jgi:hypothetical protein
MLTVPVITFPHLLNCSPYPGALYQHLSYAVCHWALSKTGSDGRGRRNIDRADIGVHLGIVECDLGKCEVNICIRVSNTRSNQRVRVCDRSCPCLLRPLARSHIRPLVCSHIRPLVRSHPQPLARPHIKRHVAHVDSGDDI